MIRRRTLLKLAGGAALGACVPGPPPPTPAPDDVARMPVEEQVGQLMTVAFHGRTVTPQVERLIRARRLGGVIVFAENAGDAAELRALTAELGRIATESGGPPLLIAMDHEGGAVVRVGRGLTVLPGAMALAATPDPVASVRRATAIAAAELRSAGITWALGPVADVNDEPRNPIIGSRAFGSDPQRVARLVAASVETYAAAGLAASAKHFPGHGSTTVDSHTGLPELEHDRARLDRVELVPFRSAIEAGVPAVMTAHIRLPAIDPDVPATLSPRVLDGLLRGDLRFGGVIVSDDLEMDALRSSGSVPEVAVRAVAAGADHLLFRFDEAAQLEAHRLMTSAVQDGRIPAARLEASVKRVLDLKRRYAAVPPPAVDATANAAAALELARLSLTLLRNDGVLPLRGRILAVSVRDADITVLPDRLSLGDALAARGAQVVAQSVGLRPSAAEREAALAAARAADLVVVGTANLLTYEPQAELVRELAALRPTALVSLRSPYDVLAAPAVRAFVCVYHGRPVGVTAAAELLLGEIRSAGRLPVEIPGLYPIGSGM